MFTKLQLSIIVLLVILAMIYSLQQTEYFSASGPFRLKLTGTDTYLFNNPNKDNEFDVTKNSKGGAYYEVDSKSYLICKHGFNTKIYKDKCFFYVTNSNGSNSNSKKLTSDKCSSKKENIISFKDGVISYHRENTNSPHYLQKENFKFRFGKSSAAKFEKVYD
jgi:hypothetical protein